MTGYLSSNMDYMIENTKYGEGSLCQSGMKPAAHQEK